MKHLVLAALLSVCFADFSGAQTLRPIQRPAMTPPGASPRVEPPDAREARAAPNNLAAPSEADRDAARNASENCLNRRQNGAAAANADRAMDAAAAAQASAIADGAIQISPGHSVRPPVTSTTTQNVQTAQRCRIKNLR
ncbi:MAG TPA: hypothetical protein VM915_15910 [Verrucomicrobiae bacterium]|nr:hypothetical protein [Verrucomicrobiae bacterium]